jgi:hypothetical protein
MNDTTASPTTPSPVSSIPRPIDILDPCNSRSGDTFVAAFVSTLSGLFIILGINFYRHSWNTTSNRFMTIFFGLVMMDIGIALMFLANNYAPELYTTPLLSFMIPFNFVIARSVNNEIVQPESFMHGMYIMIACLLASTASSICPSNDHSVVDVPGIVVWGVLSGSGGLLLMCVLINSKIIKKYERSTGQIVGGCILSACLLANASIATRAIVLHQYMIPLVILIIALAVVGIIVLTMTLAETRALTVVPIFVAAYIIIDVMGGAIFFAELHNFTGLRIAVFLIAVLIIIVAAVLQIAVEDFDAPVKKIDVHRDGERGSLAEQGRLNGSLAQ